MAPISNDTRTHTNTRPSLGRQRMLTLDVLTLDFPHRLSHQTEVHAGAPTLFGASVHLPHSTEVQAPALSGASLLEYREGSVLEAVLSQCRWTPCRPSICPVPAGRCMLPESSGCRLWVDCRAQDRFSRHSGCPATAALSDRILPHQPPPALRYHDFGHFGDQKPMRTHSLHSTAQMSRSPDHALSPPASRPPQHPSPTS
jgi:hypothetical protein